MFPGTYVPRYLYSPVPMFPGFFTLIVVISIFFCKLFANLFLEHDSRLGICLGFRLRVFV